MSAAGRWFKNAGEILYAIGMLVAAFVGVFSIGGIGYELGRRSVKPCESPMARDAYHFTAICPTDQTTFSGRVYPLGDVDCHTEKPRPLPTPVPIVSPTLDAYGVKWRYERANERISIWWSDDGKIWHLSLMWNDPMPPEQPQIIERP